MFIGSLALAYIRAKPKIQAEQPDKNEKFVFWIMSTAFESCIVFQASKCVWIYFINAIQKQNNTQYGTFNQSIYFKVFFLNNS